MPLWLQNLIVLAVVGACATTSVWQVIGGMRSGRGKCCAHGCGAANKLEPTSEKVMFLPAESLRRRAR